MVSASLNATRTQRNVIIKLYYSGNSNSQVRPAETVGFRFQGWRFRICPFILGLRKAKPWAVCPKRFSLKPETGALSPRA